MALRPTNWLLRGILFQACLVACSAGEGDDTTIPTTGGTTSTTGGTPSATGGVVSTGGVPTATGGVVNTGGIPSTGTGGTTGGSISTPTGGTSTGGTTGGFGNSTGGKSGMGGSTGGLGNNTGGKSGTGGSTGGTTGGNRATGGTSTGGSKATGGTNTGGTTGGTKATGGTGTGGSVTNTGAGPTVKCGCLTSAGEYGSNPIGSTIVVDGGEVFDGQCKTFRASNALGDGSQAEGQKPIFEVGGATIQNVIIGNSAADGIHIEEGGNVTLKNIHWLDIGEDAMSMGSDRGGNPTITMDCGSSAQGSDKTFQVNSPSNWVFKNFTAKTAGKFMRQNGDSTFKMSVSIDHCDIADMSESIYRTDSSSSTVSMTNTRYHNIGKALFIFGSSNVNGDTHNQVGTFSGNVSY
jgi:hypothetical protein